MTGTKWLRAAKKIVALTLTIAMISLCAFVPQVFALEQEPVDRSGEPGWDEGVSVDNGTFASALGSGGVLILTEDISLSSALTHSGDLTVFGNGHTITFSTSARINLTGSGALKVYDLNIEASAAIPAAGNNGAGVFCVNGGAAGSWTADFYSASFTGAALAGTNAADSFSLPVNYFSDVSFHETNTLVAKDYRALNAVVFARNVTIEGVFTMSSDSGITTADGARVGYYFKSPGTSSPASEYSTGARGTHLAYGSFKIAENANVNITRTPNTTSVSLGTNVYLEYLRSLIYGYEKHIFGENSSFYAKANTNRNNYQDLISDDGGNAANFRSAIIRSEAASEFIVERGAYVGLETDESVSGSENYGFTALLLRKATPQLIFTVDRGATLDVTARGNFGTDVVSGRARAPIMIMGAGSTATTVYGAMNISTQNGNGWYYAYNALRSYNEDTFTVDGGRVNITAKGSEGNRAASAPSEYAAFEHYNDNRFTLDIKNGGLMQFNVTGWRAMSLAGTALSAGGTVKTVNISGAGSRLLVNPDGTDGNPTGYAQFAIAAEGIITFNLNITNGGEMYARNTQDSSIYTVGTANYNISGSGSKLTLIKTGTNSAGSNKYSLFGAIFHDTNGPLNINVSDGAYMWVESSYGSRAAITAQTYTTGHSNITVDGSGSELYVINKNTDLSNYLGLNTYLEDSALYPIGAIAFAANTSGNVTVKNGANFYAESHNPISPTIALGAYSFSANSGVFTADNPGEIDIRNDGSLANGSGTVDIRGIALRGRNNYAPLNLTFADLGKGALSKSSDSIEAINVVNSEITVFERNGGYDKAGFEDWGEEHIIRHWRNTSFSAANVGTTGGVTNADGSSGANGTAAASGSTAAATDFTLNDYGRIYIRGVVSGKTVAPESEAGVNGAAVKAGDLVTYAITYVNYRDEAADLVITDILPDGLEYVSHTGDATVSGDTIEWQVLGVESGASGEVRLIARVTTAEPGTVTNKASLEWAFADGSTGKQEPGVTNPVLAGSTKYVGSDSEAGANGEPVRLGDEITYEIQYVNNTGSVSNVVISDTLPESLTYVSSDGSFDGIDTVTWSIQDVAIGGSGTVTVTVRVTDVENADKIVNSATLVWNGEEGNPETPDVSNPVGASKYVADGSPAGVDGAVVKPDDEIIYEIKYVNNTGEDNAKVTITDVLSAGLSYRPGTATEGGAVSFEEMDGTLTWIIENIGKGESGTVSFTAKVASDLTGISRIVNRAGLEWQTTDGTVIPDEAETTNPVENAVCSAKYVSPDSPAGTDGKTVYVGDVITYEIAYVNNNGEAADLVISDKMPAGLKYISSTDGGVYDTATATVSWSVQGVPVNGYGFVSVTAMVTEDAGAVIENSASLDWSWDGGSGTDTEEPNVETPVGSSKYIFGGSAAGTDGTPVTVGDEITYEIKYVNNTGDTASLTITDTLPTGVEYVSHRDESGNEQTNGSSPISWTFNDVPNGGAGAVRVTVRVTEAAAGSAEIVNSAELAWTTSGGGNTETEEPEISLPLGSSKYIADGNGAGGTAVQVGDELTYTIAYINNTGSMASLTISDTMPAGISYVSSTDGGVYGGGTVTWTFSDLPAGATGSVTVTVKVTENAGAEIKNKASLSWNGEGGAETEEPETTNPLATSKYVSSESADGVGGVPVRLGDEITYEIKYVNNTGAVSNVEITDILPNELEYISNTGGGSFNGTDTITWSISNVAAGGTGTVSVTLRVADVSNALVIKNQAAVTWSADPGSPEAPETENPVGSSKYVGSDSSGGQDGAAVKQGDEITYTIKYVNNTGVAADVTITDSLPNGLENPVNYGSGTYDSASNTITWTIANVAAGDSGMVSFTATVGDVSSVALIINRAGLEWSVDGTTLPEELENTNPAVNPTKSTKYVSENSATGANGAAVNVGDLITYDIIYVNSTGADADLKITDTLGAGLEFVSATQGGAETSEGSGVIEWIVTNIPVNASGTVTITARVTEEADDTVVNNADFDWGNDGEDANDESSAINNPLGSRKGIESVNGVSGGAYETVKIGDEVTYKISYINRTGAPADVTVTDELPAGLEYIGHTGEGAYDEATNSVVWSFGNVNPDEGGTLTVTVRVTGEIGDRALNSAKVLWSDGTEENPDIETPVSSSKYVAEGSSGENGAPVAVGDEITYTIRYVNNYDVDAYVIITDTLSAGLRYVDSTPKATQNPNGTLSWEDVLVKPGESGSVQITVVVTKEAIDEGRVENSASFAWAGMNEEELGEETGNAENLLKTSKMLSLVNGEDREAGADINVGDVLTYEIVYANQTGAASDVTITDALAKGLKYLDSSNGGQEEGGTVTWTITNVAPGEAGAVTVRVEVTNEIEPNDNGMIVNTASVKWSTQTEPELPGTTDPVKTYTVTYNANGGTGSYEDAGIAEGASYSVLTDTAAGVSRSGHTFTGWNTKADGLGTSYAPTQTVTISGNLTLYAQWEEDLDGEVGTTPPPTTPPTNPPTEPPTEPQPETPPEEIFSTDHFAYIIGYSDGYVRPGSNITRGEVTTVFFRLLNEAARKDYWSTANDYPDVPAEAWFNNSISVMTNLGVINGYPNGEFGPGDHITRGELAAIAARFARLSGSEAISDKAFNDISGHWAKDDILYAASVGWINGYPDGSFRPDAYITRAEFIAIVNRMNKRAPENTGDLLPNMVTWPDNADTSSWYYLDVQEATNSHFYEHKETLVPGGGYPYETWTEFRPSPNWSVLEKPNSNPGDLVIS